MSGTTNTLVEISDYLYKKNPEGANNIINQLEQKYRAHVEELYSTEEYKEKTLEFLKEEFDYLRSFTKILFTSFEEKIISILNNKQRYSKYGLLVISGIIIFSVVLDMKDTLKARRKSNG
jgi:hypothetical protein